jgi:hypothetical protein
MSIHIFTDGILDAFQELGLVQSLLFRVSADGKPGIFRVVDNQTVFQVFVREAENEIDVLDRHPVIDEFNVLYHGLIGLPIPRKQPGNRVVLLKNPRLPRHLDVADEEKSRDEQEYDDGNEQRGFPFVHFLERILQHNGMIIGNTLVSNRIECGSKRGRSPVLAGKSSVCQ